MSIKKFYSYEEVREFLLKYDFIYKIPKTRHQGDYYMVYIRDEDNVITYCTTVPVSGYIFHMHIEFYDLYNMTTVQFGVRRNRFEIDPKLLAIRDEKIKNLALKN